jgi:hypothetical protein
LYLRCISTSELVTKAEHSTRRGPAARLGVANSEKAIGQLPALDDRDERQVRRQGEQFQVGGDGAFPVLAEG